MNMVFIQFIGAVAYALLSYSYFRKEKKQILFVQIMAYLFFTIHYYLLNGITGALCNLIGLFALLSIYIFEKYSKSSKNVVAYIFILVLFIVNIISFQNIFSIFPMIASTIAIISFLTNSEHTIRKIGMVSAICWLIYAIVYKSYISIIFEVITLTSTLVAFIKHKEG